MAGPWIGQMLADFGADVIKVERPGAGDDTRGWGPPFLKASDGNDTQESGYYLSVNRGKRSLTLAIDKPEGQEIVRKLAARSDILLENFKLGTLARYGLGYDDLRKLNPRLIYCSITGFGQTGPLAPKVAYDFLIPGDGRPDEHHRRTRWPPRRRSAEGRHSDSRSDDGNVWRSRRARGAREPRSDAGAAITSISQCSMCRLHSCRTRR